MSNTFHCETHEESGISTIYLHADFVSSNWPALETEYRKQLQENQFNWQLDLSGLEMLDSQTLGQIVGFNTILEANNGQLTVQLEKGSKIDHLLKLTKVDLILNLEYLSPAKTPQSESEQTEDADSGTSSSGDASL